MLKDTYIEGSRHRRLSRDVLLVTPSRFDPTAIEVVASRAGDTLKLDSRMLVRVNVVVSIFRALFDPRDFGGIVE